MLSRAIPFNGSIGVTSYVGPGVLSGATLTSPTLNLAVDTIYEFEGAFSIGSAGASVDLWFNGDTTTTNYDRQVIGGSGVSPQSAYGNNARIYSAGALNDITRIKGTIFRDSGGFVVLEGIYSVRTTTNLASYRMTMIWRTTGVNLTSIQFAQSAGSLGAASWMYVFKKSPLTALNNASNLDVTVNPSNPVNGQRVRRVDATTIANLGGPTWVVYNSTLGVWLTEQEYVLAPTPVNAIQPTTQTNQSNMSYAVRGDYQMYLVALRGKIYVVTPNNPTNFWTINLQSYNLTGTLLLNIVSPTTAADTASQYSPHDVAINALLSTSANALFLTQVKTLTPGGVYTFLNLHYRLVIP